MQSTRSTKVLTLAVFMIAGALFCCGQDQARNRAQSAGAPQPAEKPSAQPAGPSATSPYTVAPFAEHNPRYSLRPGDVMDLTFAFSPEFNQSVAVQPDGFVTLRDIGDVHVAGQTVPQVTSMIKSAYSKILNDPALAIVLRDFEKPYFIAAGDVAKPGKYELRDDTTLTEAVAIAGRFDASAKHSRVVLYRKTSNEWMEGKVVDVKKMMASRSLAEDIHLNPGDMIFVPRSAFSKFQRYIPSPGVGMGFSPIP
jgi:polysaccharide export outer membrane protein